MVFIDFNNLRCVFLQQKNLNDYYLFKGQINLTQ